MRKPLQCGPRKRSRAVKKSRSSFTRTRLSVVEATTMKTMMAMLLAR